MSKMPYDLLQQVLKGIRTASRSSTLRTSENAQLLEPSIAALPVFRSMKNPCVISHGQIIADLSSEQIAGNLLRFTEEKPVHLAITTLRSLLEAPSVMVHHASLLRGVSSPPYLEINERWVSRQPVGDNDPELRLFKEGPYGVRHPFSSILYLRDYVSPALSDRPAPKSLSELPTTNPIDEEVRQAVLLLTLSDHLPLTGWLLGKLLQIPISRLYSLAV